MPRLKDQIEELIHQGHPGRFFHKPREPLLSPYGLMERQIDVNFTHGIHRKLHLPTWDYESTCHLRWRVMLQDANNQFIVVDIPSAYNTIINLYTLNWLKAIVSTYHMMMKFSTRAGINELRSNLWEFTNATWWQSHSQRKLGSSHRPWILGISGRLFHTPSQLNNWLMHHLTKPNSIGLFRSKQLSLRRTTSN